MNTRPYLLTSLSLALVLLATVLSACGAPTGAGGLNPLPTTAPTAIPPAPSSLLSEAVLKNATYELPDIGTVQLKEGKFELKYGQGASQVNRGDLQRVVLGDLNGDGAQDAVVILAFNTGGSGAFVYMIVVVNQNGAPKQVAAEMLGDRTQIKALSIANGQLDIDFLGFGPKDPMCCPSQATTRAYRLQGNTLVKISDSSPATNTGKLTEDMLKNGKYTLPDIGAVQLKDGKFEHKYGDGATQVNTVGYMQAALGDLNGDKADDAVVILWANTGGSGTFLYLVVAANQNGAPRQVAAQLLGDRIKVQNLAVQNGQIVINVLSFGPNDPMCCPSQLVIRTYRLEGGALKVMSEVKPTAGANASVVNIVWQWERFDDTAGINSIKVDDPTQYTLKLLPDGTYQVKADCNLGNGKYVLEGSSLKLGPMAMTRAACAPDSLSDKYVARLGDVATFVLRDGKLYLNLKMDSGNMVFRQAEQPPATGKPAGAGDTLAGSSWMLMTLKGQPALKGTTVTLNLTAGQAAGSDGCNTYNTSYTADGARVKFNQPIATTMMACPEPVMTQASAYLQVLGQAAAFKTNGKQLSLLDAGGKELAMFAAQSSDLGGTSWIATGYNNGKQTVVSVQLGTEITANFGGDGKLTGSAGCNIYTAAYETSDKNIKISPASTTRKACEQAVMDQETQYLAALQTAATYRMDGNKLELRTANGALAASFQKAAPGQKPATGLQPSQIRLDTQGLPYSWQPVLVPATPYDASQPPGPMGLPEHIEILFGAATRADRQPGTPVMYIIPVDAYRQLWDSKGNPAVSSQLTKIYSKTVALPSPAPTSSWPALPVEEIAGRNDLAVQVAHIASNAKRGYRFVGRWMQDANPVTNQNLKYVYQGLTNDGKYLVAFFYPVTTSALPRTAAQVPADEMAQFTADPTAFIQRKATELNTLPPTAWDPDLTKLDALVGSLQIEGK